MTDEALEPGIEIGRYALRTFSDKGTWLGSVGVQGRHWHDGICEAKCVNTTIWAERRVHSAPQEGCTCGIYGTLSYEALHRQYRHESEALVTVMAAEGETIIGDTGLKTAAARIVAWWAPQRVWTLRAAILASMEFPDAKHYKSLDAMLDAYKIPRQETSNLRTLRIPHTIDDIKRAGGKLRLTIHNPPPGEYNEVELSDGTTCRIPPTTPWPSDAITIVLTWNPTE